MIQVRLHRCYGYESRAVLGRWLPEHGSRLIVSEARTQANHSDTVQMTAGHIVDEVAGPPARQPAGESSPWSLVSPQHRAAAVLSTGRFTARPKSGRWRQATRIYNPIKRLHDAVVRALSSLLWLRLADTDRHATTVPGQQHRHKSLWRTRGCDRRTHVTCPLNYVLTVSYLLYSQLLTHFLWVSLHNSCFISIRTRRYLIRVIYCLCICLSFHFALFSC